MLSLTRSVACGRIETRCAWFPVSVVGLGARLGLPGMVDASGVMYHDYADYICTTSATRWVHWLNFGGRNESVVEGVPSNWMPTLRMADSGCEIARAASATTKHKTPTISSRDRDGVYDAPAYVYQILRRITEVPTA